MKMRQPLALLLGGIMSVTSVGCATFNAMSDNRPAASGKKASAERLVSIGRVFENQGKYDQAEDMYRKALKQRPNDPVIREQLTQLADRRAGRTFGPENAGEAIAMADAISSSGRNAAAASSSKTATPSTPVAAAKPSAAKPSAATIQTASTGTSAKKTTSTAAPSTSNTLKNEKDAGVQFASATSGTVRIAATPAVHEEAPKPPAEEIPVKSRGITFEDVLAKTEGASGHAAWLRKAVCEADSTEARTLAATLLAECDPAEAETNTVLFSRLNCESDAGLRLAICESLATRGCKEAEICRTLTEISAGGNAELQIQAITCLRHFAGTETRDVCLSVLEQLLASENPQVRATAAVTVGDFAPESETILGHLTTLAAEDSDATVREAARTAIGRRDMASVETAEPILIQPGTIN